MTIETGSYSDFSHGVVAHTTPLRVPITGTIEVTRRCPLTCAHCYNNLPMSDEHARAGELTLDEHRRVLDELAELGMLWLLYTGGEIFARHDFLDIYRHARRSGMLVTLFTNATLVTDRVADALAAEPPFDIEVTLYGATKKTYELLTGIPGSYEHCMRGIERMLERRLPVKLKTVAVTINRHEIRAMQHMAEGLGVEFKFDPMITPRIDCSAAPLAVRMTPADIVALDLEYPERIAEWRRIATTFDTPPLAEGEMPGVYDCGGGLNSFAIDPAGLLSICVLSHMDKFDLRKGSVREGWDQFLRAVRGRPATRITKCQSCPLSSLCGSCAANAELENGDPEKPVDFLCRTAHLRAEVFGVDVRPHGDCEYCRGGIRHDWVRDTAGDVMTRSGSEIEAAMAMPLPDVAASGCATGGCGGCSAAR
jgi:radical SAM protein with 4Fe4S-binding SPASM domain